MPAQAGIHLRIRLKLKKLDSGFHRNGGKKTQHRNEQFQIFSCAPEASQLALNSKCSGRILEIPPQPPFFEADFRPVDRSIRSPGARLGDAEGRPAGGISRSVSGGASSAVGEQSYGVQPEIHRPALAGDLDGEIVRQHIGFLVRDTAGF